MKSAEYSRIFVEVSDRLQESKPQHLAVKESMVGRASRRCKKSKRLRSLTRRGPVQGNPESVAQSGRQVTRLPAPESHHPAGDVATENVQDDVTRTRPTATSPSPPCKAWGAFGKTVLAQGCPAFAFRHLRTGTGTARPALLAGSMQDLHITTCGSLGFIPVLPCIELWSPTCTALE